jgi:type I restriction enzyme, S subunit
MNKQKLPEGWKELTIKEICKSISDGNYSSKYPRQDEFFNEGIPFVRANNFQNNTIVWKDMRYISKEKHSELKKGHLKENDVLITTRGQIGNLALVPKDFHDANINAQIVRLEADKEILEPKYLLMILKAPGVVQQINSNTTGTTLKQLPVNKLIKIKIPIPPLDVQRNIMVKAEKAENSKEWRKEADDLTKDFLKSVFFDMFKDKGDFENKKLMDICDVQSGGTPSRTKKEYWDNGNIPWLGSTVCKDRYVSKSKQFITEEGLKNSSTRFFKKGTILVALVGATIGKTAYLNFEATTNQNIAGIYPKEGIDLNSEYLFYAIQTLYYRFMSLSSDTFKMANLTFIRNLEIPLPPTELQNKFASIVKEVEDMKEQQKHSKNQIDNLFNALMQKAFKGELKC